MEDSRLSGDRGALHEAGPARSSWAESTELRDGLRLPRDSRHENIETRDGATEVSFPKEGSRLV